MTKNVYVLKQKAKAKLFQCLGILQIMIQMMIQMQTAVYISQSLINLLNRDEPLIESLISCFCNF